MLHVRLAARVVEKSDEFAKGEQTVVLEINTQDLTQEQHELLNELFPNTYNKIEEALTTEAIVSSVRKLGNPSRR